MTANGIAFEERDIDSSPDYMQQLKSLNRRMTIPTFDIDGSVSIGFHPGRIVWLLQRAATRRALKGALWIRPGAGGVLRSRFRARKRLFRSVGCRIEPGSPQGFGRRRLVVRAGECRPRSRS